MDLNDTNTYNYRLGSLKPMNPSASVAATGLTITHCRTPIGGGSGAPNSSTPLDVTHSTSVNSSSPVITSLLSKLQQPTSLAANTSADFLKGLSPGSLTVTQVTTAVSSAPSSVAANVSNSSTSSFQPPTTVNSMGRVAGTTEFFAQPTPAPRPLSR